MTRWMQSQESEFKANIHARLASVFTDGFVKPSLAQGRLWAPGGGRHGRSEIINSSLKD